MIETFLINSLIIFGVHASTRQGQVLHFIAKFVYGSALKVPSPKEAYYRTIISKVLFDCPPCMSSLYGSIGFSLFIFPDLSLWWMVGWVFSLCGFNYLLNKL